MPLDPQVKFFLEELEAAGAPSFDQLSVEENRSSTANFIPLGGEPEQVAKIENVLIPTREGEIKARIYTPEGDGPFPVFVYFHGGGWVIGDLDVVDTPLRAVANAAEAMIVSVSYRLAPEQRFPTAPEDCYDATQWVADNIANYNGDPKRIAVGGDSAGGNLAAVVSLMAKERKGPAIAYQVLIYPVTDFAFNTASYHENGEGYLLTRGAMEWFANHYIDEDDKAHPYASPLQAADLSGLPPALVLTAEFDPLRDEGELYAARLKEAGVAVEATRYEGAIHGFFWLAGIMDHGKKSIQQISHALKSKFS